ncbi:hypothetical protein PBPRA2804 [Photobacterium profundum SS9]|uniref:Uncharacterized protein n=1 Tax=Photobacterium profundum (strain SS9) TaxID=298386 RepID=Q6LNF0_PHOPR|nr:hypothetical protein PBPRA2804 [Photobacterium profundum SS9]
MYFTNAEMKLSSQQGNVAHEVRAHYSLWGILRPLPLNGSLAILTPAMKDLIFSNIYNWLRDFMHLMPIGWFLINRDMTIATTRAQ